MKYILFLLMCFSVNAEVIEKKYKNEDGLKCTIINTTPNIKYIYTTSKEIRKLAKKHSPNTGRARGQISYRHDGFNILYRSGKCKVYIPTDISEKKQAEVKEHEEDHCMCGKYHPEKDFR